MASLHIRYHYATCITTLLPPILNLGANVGIVDLAPALHRLIAQRWQLRSLYVVLRLLRAFGAWDSAGDLREHQDPAQRQLRHSGTLWYKWTQRFDRLQTRLVVDAREGFALIEGLTMAVIHAVIVGGKLRLGVELAGQQAACQRDASQDANAMFSSSSKEPFRWFEAEHIEDNLDALYIGKIGRASCRGR